MPEAAVDEDDQLAAGHDHVRLARQVLAMKAIAGSESGQEPPHGLLGSGVASFDPSHDGRALFRVEDVGHSRVASGQRLSRAVPVRTAAPS